MNNQFLEVSQKKKKEKKKEKKEHSILCYSILYLN